MSKHTKGPWRTEWLGEEQGYIMDDKGNYIAEIVAYDEEGRYCPDEMEANARLMAAAPEMLEALSNAEKTLREDMKKDAALDGVLMVLQIAIAKVENTY